MVRAARILESWARVEESAGNRQRAMGLFMQSANHYNGIGMQLELERLLAEVKRLQD